MLLGVLVASDGRTFSSLSMKPNRNDLTFLRDLIEEGKVASVVDRCHLLQELYSALEYDGYGHSRGKLMVAMGK